MSHRKSILLLTAFFLTLAPPLISAPGGQEEKRPPSRERLDLETFRVDLKDGGFVEAERGMIQVPLRRDASKSRATGVEVYRFKASTPGGDVPPIFQLHGGPSFSGLAAPLKNRGFYERNIAPMTRISDVVVVGQRGIGASDPDTACEPPQQLPFSARHDRSAIAENYRQASRACRSTWESRGWDLKGFTVVEAAHDVDDVRQALGYQKIILTGGSFGSHWAMTIMRYHPEIVARALLSGMEGPDHTYDMPGWVLNSLTRMAAAAEKAPGLRDGIPEGGLIEAFKAVIARLDKEPATVQVKNPLTRKVEQVRVSGDDIRSLSLGYSGRVSSRTGMRTWPRGILDLYHERYARAARELIRRQQRRSFPTASYFMLDCGSGISPQREAALNADPGAQVVGKLGEWYQINCPAWESDLGNEFRKNFDTDIPTVIVHGNWDVSTPYENALELRPFFKRGKLVTVIGGSHGALGEALRESDEFREALMGFLRTGDASAIPREVQLPPIDWAAPH